MQTADLGSIFSLLVQPDGKILAAGISHTGIAWARYTAAGRLDTSFGNGGVVTVPSPFSNAAPAIATSDAVLVVGSGGNYDLALARYHLDGSFDAAFGNGGIVTTDFGSGDMGTAAAIQADGRIVAIANAHKDGLCNFGVACYLPNGTLDATFGSGGLVQTNLGRPGTEPSGLAIDPASGKIVVVGSTYDGRTDFSLSPGSIPTAASMRPFVTGAVFTPILTTAMAGKVAFQGDGKIIVAGDRWRQARPLPTWP